MSKIKVGIIGCGNISGIYLENLTGLFANTEVYACADALQERAAAAAAKYGIPHVWQVEELLASDEIQIVLNLTTPASHYELCKRALLAGKHVYTEKPLALVPEHGQELVTLAREKGLLLGCAPDTFLGGGLQTCRKLIDDGFIGDPVAATAFMVCHGHEGWHPDPAFYYEAGGGPMFDMGPYYLTALLTLMGPVKTVAGMTSTPFPKRTITSAPKYGQTIDVQVPTHVAGTLQFASGAVATMIMSFDIWSSTLPRIEIYGTRGTLIVPDPNTFGGPVLFQPAGGAGFTEIPLLYGYAANSRGIGVSDLADSLLTGEKPRAGGDLANHVLEIMQAFHTSSDSKRYVELVTSCERPRPLPQGLIPGHLHQP
ncbi:Gfo/Idh/MocA family oxidoreductase [Gorillibacterium sp. CAU 1737]|uniref:Gfo/Idh/MocA family protein n=1 Tax=Gorillibacterium sp. CAU 1737 TaxID=3140362 RepID=UPI003260C4B3